MLKDNVEDKVTTEAYKFYLPKTTVVLVLDLLLVVSHKSFTNISVFFHFVRSRYTFMSVKMLLLVY
jgi:hypothetical protein